MTTERTPIGWQSLANPLGSQLAVVGAGVQKGLKFSISRSQLFAQLSVDLAPIARRQDDGHGEHAYLPVRPWSARDEVIRLVSETQLKGRPLTP